VIRPGFATNDNESTAVVDPYRLVSSLTSITYRALLTATAIASTDRSILSGRLTDAADATWWMVTIQTWTYRGHMARRQLWDVPRSGWEHGLFAASLALTTLSAIVGARRSTGVIALIVGLSSMLAGWYGYWFIRRGIERRPDRSANLAYLIGAAALWAVMTAVDPAMLLVGVVALVPYCLRNPL
jgi:hypothetical protein